MCGIPVHRSSVFSLENVKCEYGVRWRKEKMVPSFFSRGFRVALAGKLKLSSCWKKKGQRLWTGYSHLKTQMNLKAKEHIIPECTMACRLKVIVDMNSFSQMSHLNGFTPVCRPMWDCSSSWVRNVLSHSTHLKGLSPVCTACRTNNASIWISVNAVSSITSSNEGNLGGASVGPWNWLFWSGNL